MWYYGLFPEKSLKLEKYFFFRLPNQLTDLVQNRYLGFSRKYLEPFFLVIPLTLKLMVGHMRKKFKISNFSKMALTIVIKFCGFIVRVHSKPNNMTLSAFPRKILGARIIYKPIGEWAVTEWFENELCSFSKLSVTSPTSQLILQPFPRFTYVTAHSPTLTLLHLRHSSFSNPSFASPTS